MRILSGRTATQIAVPRFGVDLRGHAQPAGSGAFDALAIVADAAFEQIDVADEVRDPARVRLLVDFNGWGHLHEPAAIHHADTVGDDHGLALVVGDDDECEPERALQFHQLEARLVAQFLVERRHRLVEQQHARPLDQRARQRHALALAAGKLVRLAQRRNLRA